MVDLERTVRKGAYDDVAPTAASTARVLLSRPSAAETRDDPALLFHRGVEALRANDVVAAIELLIQAVELGPSDPKGRLQLGVALQAAGRHAEALERFKAAQDSPGNDPAPFLHAAISYLAIGDNRAALVAASEACWRAPKLAAAHYAYGQAWTALGEAGRAEQAFAAAIQLSAGPTPGSIMASHAIARARLKTPRPPCGGR
jgi:Flp pilus assembly protein TadD